MITLRAIDLELRIREALYELSIKKLQRMLNGKDIEVLFDLAWGITPKIFPQVEPAAISQIIALAMDLPELMTKEPESNPHFDLDILPLTPLRVLHANVIDLVVHFGKDEIARMPRIMPLSGDSRHVYNMMQKHYFLGGFISQGVSRDTILREVFGRIDKIGEEKARAIVKELMKQGFAAQSSDEAYQLSVLERSRLIERYHLGNRWPDCYPKSSEVAAVQRAMEQQQEK